MIPQLKAHMPPPPKPAGVARGTRPTAPFSVSRRTPHGHTLPKSTESAGISRPGTPPTPSATGTNITAAATAGANEGRAMADDPLDPLERRRAFDMGFFPATPTVAPAHSPLEAIPVDASHRASPSLEVLLPALVRKIAWSGDGRRGSVRMELGAGPLAGGVLLVHADGANVSVHLDAPPGADKVEWHARITRALEGRGLHATVEVD